jgi:hypothetical protein
MTKKPVLVCLVLVLALTLVLPVTPQAPVKKPLSIRDKVNQALGGKVVRVDENTTYPEDSLVQRVTLIVEKNGTQTRASMDYRFDKTGKIVERRLYGSDNRVLWSMDAVAMLTAEERADGYNKCLEGCERSCGGGRRAKRLRCLAVCGGSCELLYYYDAYGNPLK